MVPPLTGTAVKVTTEEAQTGLADAPAETLTGRFGFTVMVTIFEVAGLPDLQVRLDVMIT